MIPLEVMCSANNQLRLNLPSFVTQTGPKWRPQVLTLHLDNVIAKVKQCLQPSASLSKTLLSRGGYRMGFSWELGGLTDIIIGLANVIVPDWDVQWLLCQITMFDVIEKLLDAAEEDMWVRGFSEPSALGAKRLSPKSSWTKGRPLYLAYLEPRGPLPQTWQSPINKHSV